MFDPFQWSVMTINLDAALDIVSRLSSLATPMPIVQMVMMNSTVPVNATLKLII